MLEILQKIFENDIMYHVIVPIIILIFGWIKNWYDIKAKNKKMGYWKIKVRREYCFNVIIMNSYKLMTINLLIMYFVKYISSFWIEEWIAYTIVGIIYVIINVLIIFSTVKQPKTKIELWTDRRIKQILIGILWLIFSIMFFLDIIPQYEYIVLIVNGVALIGWYIFLLRYTDMVFVLDKSYADIYVNGAEVVKYIYAGSMKKNGGWIYVDRNIEGYEEEIRIKESEIVRIDYYGEPIIYIQNCSMRRN